jgi:hypothetical protein
MRNRYYLDGNYAYIAIETKDGEIQCTVIDAKFVEPLNCVDGLLSIHKDGYVYVSHKNGDGKIKTLALQRFITNPVKNQVVDHINHNKLDNTLVNLRCVSLAINNQNRLMCNSNSKSKRLNVHWNALCNKWEVRLCINGKRKSFGFYENKNKATKKAKKLRAIYYPGSQEYLYMPRAEER